MVKSVNKFIINSILLLLIAVVAFVYLDLQQTPSLTFEQNTPQAVNNTAATLATTATVQRLEGEALLTSTNGESSALNVGDKVQVGDVINTQAAAIAELNFTDNSNVTLYENTELEIIDYSFTDAKAGSNIAQLLRGQMRVVSGLIGKRENDVYALRTHVSTIGIRGTEYIARFCHKQTCFIDDKAIKSGLYLGVIEGEIVSESTAGATIVKPGEVYYQLRQDQPAQKINLVPGLFVEGQRIATAEPDARQWILETTE